MLAGDELRQCGINCRAGEALEGADCRAGRRVRCDERWAVVERVRLAMSLSHIKTKPGSVSGGLGGYGDGAGEEAEEEEADEEAGWQCWWQ